MNNSDPNGRAPLRAKCPPCAKATGESHRFHDGCWRVTGDGDGRCNCAQCHYQEIWTSAARAYETSNNLGIVREALGQMLALGYQRWHRMQQIERAAPAYQGRCEYPPCMKDVYSSPYGRKKRYCSEYHRKLTGRMRRAERERENAA